MLIRKQSKVVFKKITLTICTLFIQVLGNSVGAIKNEQSRDTGNIGHKTRNEEKHVI